jgi:conjugative relaxase-like TrwC/TraI family protein
VLTISKPITAAQAVTYHSKEFTSSEQAYYTQSQQIQGEWVGKLAEEWGLSGRVSDEHFGRIANGEHPLTGQQLIRHRESYEYRNENGEITKTMEHRAGWDATFSAPKSVSLTALVAGDDRVQKAHRESVSVALGELEHFVQARMGGNHPAETTGKWVAAKFEHDSARPVGGYAAPQLHTHVVFFNITETHDGKAHSIQPRELYASQKYATAIYQAELGYRLREFGYEVEMGKNGAPEIRGYSREYLEASSPRSQQIKAHLEEHGFSGAGPAQIAAHRTRDAKIALSADEMLARHRELASNFGNQPQRVMEDANSRADRRHISIEESGKRAQEAVTFSRNRHMEREAVVGERELMTSALRRGMSEARFLDIKNNFEHRVSSGEFVAVKPGRRETPERAITTREMLNYERDNISVVKAGQNAHEPIAVARNPHLRNGVQLSNNQHQVAGEILSSRDQIVGLQGTAGAGKTTSLVAVRETAEEQGYVVKGFAPTSRAAQQLQDAGIQASTLQHFLAQPRSQATRESHLYVLDESSLASTRQVNEFLHRLQDRDRVLLVGDTRQHQGVEAGRPFQQLQEAGMHTAHLDKIVRQKDPSLRQAVEELASGDTRVAIKHLYQQGRVYEVPDRKERIDLIARTYADRSEHTLVVSPDNRSRQEINERIHVELKSRGKVNNREHRLTVLAPRQELTGADRQWAFQYEVGDIVRYSRDSKSVGVRAGEYVRVQQIDKDRNLLTVERARGKEITYDPKRLHGVTVYKETQRHFSQGERVQFTAPYREDRIPNRQLGTVTGIDSQHIRIRLDSCREVKVDARKHLHLDFGYALTSHSSQGLTADRVLLHVDSTQAHEKLINTRLAYVSISRGRYDAQIYTNSRTELAERLSREVSKRSALDSVADLHHGGLEQSHAQRAIPPERGTPKEAQQGRALERSI